LTLLILSIFYAGLSVCAAETKADSEDSEMAFEVPLKEAAVPSL
jgi:hypothetical protein